MIQITDSFYELMAKRLAEELEECRGDFFNGVVELDCEEYYAELKCSLILFRKAGCSVVDCCSVCGGCPHNNGELESVVPVWWNLDIWLDDGEHDNTFSWREFVPHLKKYCVC